VHGQPAIAHEVPRKSGPGLAAPAKQFFDLSGFSQGRKIFTLVAIAASQQEIAPQLPITWALNCAIWTPGNEAQKAPRQGQRDAGLPIAMSSVTTSTVDTPLARSVERICDDLAIIALAAVGLIASLTFRDYGLGWDDYTHAEYADLLLRMYGSGFKDTGALSFANLYMYGGGFDMAAALLHKVIPLELFETRRLVGAIVGIIGLAMT